jgi:hypothetical protein
MQKKKLANLLIFEFDIFACMPRLLVKTFLSTKVVDKKNIYNFNEMVFFFFFRNIIEYLL